MDTNNLDSTPRVWIGCLHCYNAGRLVGEWFDAVDADEATLADVHRDAGGSCVGCDELWCFNDENLPVRGEMGPNEAAE